MPRRLVLAALLLLAASGRGAGVRTWAPSVRRGTAPVRARRRRGGGGGGAAAAAGLLSLLGAPARAAAQTRPYQVDLFEFLDSNSDGAVDRVEYMYGTKDLLDRGGYKQKGLRDVFFDFTGQLYDASDVNGDEVLSKDEVNFGQWLFFHEVKRQLRERDTMSTKSDFGESTVLERHGFMGDADGRVSAKEFRNKCLVLLVTMGLDSLASQTDWSETIPLEDVIFRRADVDRDGALRAREVQYGIFLAIDIMQQLLTGALLQRLDQDRNGELTRAEVLDGEISRVLGHRAPYLSDAQVVLQRSFDNIDVDGDGALDRSQVMLFAMSYLARLLAA